jgi:galactose mutarotase-like enzyme
MPNVTTHATHAVRNGAVDEHRICTLSSYDAELQVSFAPGLGMLACSMLHAGEELLGQRSGLAAYARSGATMGIPLLYPWANRLGGFRYRFAGRTVEIDGRTPLDEHGLPIHGLLQAVRGWSPTGSGADGEAAWVSAELDVGQRSDILSAFPFPHSVEVVATLRRRALSIATTVRPTADVAVPVTFGHHPYLRLPALPRAAWQVQVPGARRLELDDRGIPTGRSEASAPIRGPLGRRTFDDGFVLDGAGQPFVLAGGGRRIQVAFDEGYPCAQVFAPPDDDVVCFEPMTAPTDALRGCLGPPPAVSPGGCYRARFTITVERGS